MATRYLPHSKKDIELMLEKIGVKNIDELFLQIPLEAKFSGQLDIQSSPSERQLSTHLTTLAKCNEEKISFLGAGNYAHYIPKAVDALISRSEFFTAYTPYQPEISQGTLQGIYEYQTAICRIFDMAVSNASMYDGATAMTEAVLMALRVSKKNKILLSSGIHPEYIEVLKTYLSAAGDVYKLEMIPHLLDSGQVNLDFLEKTLCDETACVVIGQPNFFGIIEPLDEIVPLVKKAGALAITTTCDPYAFALIKPPGSFGVDIATAEGQSFSGPPSFGGPGLGIFAIGDDKKLLRQMPGRVVGKTVDNKGLEAFTLTLSTREQHIRREKATSNICSNHGLCALAAVINLSLMGDEGYFQAALASREASEYLKSQISQLEGFELKYKGPTFNEFVVSSVLPVEQVLKKAWQKGFLAGVALSRFSMGHDDCFLVATTEIHEKPELDLFINALGSV
jgi:glycine dehydrogenase subunit 1